MTIHHAVAKKAAKLNIELLPQEDGTVRATHKDLASPVAGADAKAALAEAVKALGYKTPRPKKASNTNKKPRSKKDKAAKSALPSNKSVVKKVYKDIYRTKGSGQGNGDALDIALRDALEGDSGCLSKLSKENGVPFVWQVLNPGLQRMNVSNVLRAKINRGEKVTVLGKNVRIAGA